MVAITLVVVNAVWFVVLSERLNASVDDLLAERAGLVRTQADAVRAAGGSPADLVEDLQARGLQVLIRTSEGETLAADPTSPIVGRGLPSTGYEAVPGRSLVFGLDGGVRASVFASTAGVTTALRQLVLLQVLAGEPPGPRAGGTSATHSWFGSVATNVRPTRSGATSAAGFCRVMEKGLLQK